MANTKTKSYMDSLKQHPEGTQYQILIKYLELRSAELKDRLVIETDSDEIKRIQGRAREIRDMLKGLTRRPIVNEFDGAYGQ